MLAHYLVDVSLLCDACAAPPASLVASAALWSGLGLGSGLGSGSGLTLNLTLTEAQP